MKKLIPIAAPEIDSLIFEVRGEKAILDADLAALYGVPTKALNQALKRNSAKFPEDFVFQLSSDEAAVAATLRSQTVTSKGRRGGRRYLPFVFTEHGATVLNSPRAVAISVYVIRAFVKLREVAAANAAILKRLAEIDQTLLLHDSALRDIYQKLRPLLEPPALPPKPEMGFHVKEDAVLYRVGRQSRPSRIRKGMSAG